MKQTILFLISLLAGIVVGSYFGYERGYQKYDRELLRLIPQFEKDVAEFNKERAVDSKAAKPYETSRAVGALSALKRLDSNDLEGARANLASLIAIYYGNHSRDGDTNLLSNIVKLATTDTVLSNAIYRGPRY
jgi:hypothetical protein